MNKIDFKKTVLAKAKDRQQEVINDFKGRIQELNSTENAVEEDQLDHDQLNFVVQEMNLLNRMQIGDELHESAAIGSIVKTDKQMFFPSVSVERFDVNGQDVFGISAKVPNLSGYERQENGRNF